MSSPLAVCVYRNYPQGKSNFRENAGNSANFSGGGAQSGAPNAIWSDIAASLIDLGDGAARVILGFLAEAPPPIPAELASRIADVLAADGILRAMRSDLARRHGETPSATPAVAKARERGGKRRAA